MNTSRISDNFFRCVFLSVLFLASPSLAQNDPLALQQQAIKRIDGYLDFVRKTGDFKSRLPDLAQADSELTQSNGIFETRKDWFALALGLTKQGSIYRLQGQNQQAITFYKKAEDVAKLAQDRERQAEALSYLAQTELNMKDYGPALAEAKEAVRLADAAGDMGILADTLQTLGSVQIDVRNLDGAAETVKREIETAVKSKDTLKEYNAYYNRSNVYRGIAAQCADKPIYEVCRQALDRMMADLQKALSIVENLGFSYLVQITKDEMDNGEAQKKLLVSREQSYRRVEEAKAVWHPKKAGDVLVQQRFILPLEMRDPGTLKFLNQVKQEADEQKKKSPYATSTDALSYTIEGQMKEMQGDNKAALDFFLKAVDALERDRRSLHDEQSRGTFLEDKTGIYYNAILQLLEQHRYPEAFEIFERARSRALTDLLASRGLGLVKSEEQKLYGEMMTLRTRIAAAQGRILELANSSDPEKHDKEIRKLRSEIDAWETEHGKVLLRMGSESPRLKNLVASEPGSLEALQRSMREEGYEVLQYMVQENNLILWHISPDSINVCEVFLPRSQITEKGNAILKSIEARNATFDETTAKELFLFLIQPVLERIKSKRLVIIPHDELNSIPFQLFLDPVDGRFLGERFQISYAPSATILLGFKPTSPLAGGRLLAVADPSISFAGKEVQAIARLFPENCKVAMDAMPRECDVKAWVRDYDIVHLSVHGKFDASAPMLSYLKLGKGNGDDGQLTASEMYGLPLEKSKLVVLSACETGKVQATQGNEILGMVRGLLFAGANSLLLSNWRVESESTALWMQTFYENALTRPLPESAQAALLKVKDDPRYKHPRFWAAFALIGR